MVEPWRHNGAYSVPSTDLEEINGAVVPAGPVLFRAPPIEGETSLKSDAFGAGERIEWVSRAHAQEINFFEIDGQWRKWELARYQVPDRSVGVLEQIGVALDDVWAWDLIEGVGTVRVYDFGPQNGTRPTKTGLVHPNPAVDPLEWRFSIEGVNLAAVNRQPGVVAGSTAQQGQHRDEPWSDLWSGSATDWGQNHHRILASASVVRLLIWLRGPQDRYSLRVGGRLAGYSQLNAQRGAALRSATVRG
jgi:hypothetical protein